jgi:ABC-type Fe3+/spermidine/putrescine transport system ATPase subunit
VDGISKRFGEVLRLTTSTLDVAPGEFFTMLGPSARARRRRCA